MTIVALLLFLNTLFLLTVSVTQYSFIASLECVTDTSCINSFDGSHNAESSGYYLSGQYSYHHNHYEDRRFKWRYCRPQSPNTDYSNNPSSYTLSQTSYDATWTKECSTDEAMTTAYSTHHDYYEDRLWTFSCSKLQSQFSLTDCVSYTSWINDWDGTLSFNYASNDNVVITGIKSQHSNYREDRLYSFQWCKVREQPMNMISDPSDIDILSNRYFIGGIESTFDATNGRMFSSKYYTTPIWFSPETQATQTNYYQLTKTANESVFTRICSRNAAVKNISISYAIFDIECADVVYDLQVDDCVWTDDYVNIFGESFDFQCDGNGPMRGIQSYFSAQSNDRRFKFYCCEIGRGTYTKNNDIQIGVKTSNISYNYTTDNPILLDLCWNSYLYQTTVTPNGTDAWCIDRMFVEQYGTCGNDRTLTIANYDDTQAVSVDAITVVDGESQYVMDTFCVYSGEGICTIMDVIWLQLTDGEPSYKIYFPDDYISVCATTSDDDDDGCVGDTYNTDDTQQYLLSITECATFTASGTPHIGVVIRGLNGNLDKKIIIGPVFTDQLVGIGDVGEILSIDLELDSGDDFCIQSIALNDPYSGDVITFAQSHFADGIYLTSSCVDDGYFKQLSGIHYIPCIDTQFIVNTYESSLYTSVQIHSCTGEEGGISMANSALLSMSIVGVTSNDQITSTSALSLQSSTDWESGSSRDYTLPLHGMFEEVTLVTITNNNAEDAVCVDDILINGENAYLTHYWVGISSSDNVLQTIPAVLKWPICNIELTTTIEAKTSLPTDPTTVATSMCVNRNRLLSATCSISQTFETFEEISWQHESGSNTMSSVTIEAGAETSVSLKSSYGTEVGNDYVGKVSTSFEAGFSLSFSASVAVESGQTILDVTTDGYVNGETISIECDGEVTVGPSQQVEYTMLMENAAAELTTLTDIKMTKCSAYLYNDDDGISSDPDDYIYIYGIEGTLTSKEATNCYISYSQSTSVHPSSITCDEERAIATREWADYIPICNEYDPEMYDECQCSFGSLRKNPRCGCVDASSGNLLQETDAAVVETTVEYTWGHWCNEHCYNNYSHYITDDTESTTEITDDIESELVSENDEDGSGYNYKESESALVADNIWIYMLLAMFLIIYLVNSIVSICKTCGRCDRKQDMRVEYQRSTDHEIELDHDVETV